MNFARKGSPGMMTVLAISPIFALLCGVPLNSDMSILLCND